MKLSSCLGFVALGAIMFFWPEVFGAGTSALGQPASDRELWLRLMAITQLVLGGGFFLLQSLRQAGNWLRQWPQELPGAAHRADTTVRPVLNPARARLGRPAGEWSAKRRVA